MNKEKTNSKKIQMLDFFTDSIWTRQYLHLGIFPATEILEWITKKLQTKSEERVRKYPFFIGNIGHMVNVRSKRYQVFMKSTKCACCGLEGDFMGLDLLARVQDSQNEFPHFNLYGYARGELILMTKDHILPKAKGGKDHASNFQTMCTLCNMIKADTEMTIEEVRAERLRRVYSPDVKEKYPNDFYPKIRM